MTWIGKILTVMVMLTALVWVFLNAQSYATRTNWKVDSEKKAEALNAAINAREKDYRAFLGEKDALAKQLAAANKRADDMQAEVKNLEADVKAQKDRYTTIEETSKEYKLRADEAENNSKSFLEQVKQLRAQNNALEDDRVRSVTEKEKSLADRQQAINERNAALTRSEQLTRQNDELSGKLASYKRSGGRPDAVLDSITQRPAPVPENIRGTVDRVEGDYVELSIGLDAGLTPGAVLDVSRFKPAPKYLGKVTVGLDVRPKQAVAKFSSSTGRMLAQLRADERPKIGDVVNLIPR